jgi:hypothetical protein
MNDQTFSGWCVVELFGHNQVAGYVSEQEIGGASFVRVDVPEVDGVVAFSKLYGAGAIYAITPTSEEVARLVCGQLRARPLTMWLPELHKALPPQTIDQDELDDPAGMEFEGTEFDAR